jgi:DDE superfamily endonuclease
MTSWTAEQLVFIDESGINAKTGERTKGYGKKGKVVRKKVLACHAMNYSVLPAMTVDGYLSCNVYEGAVNGPTFKEFIRTEVLPHCSAFPGPRSVIVMDNAAIHNVYHHLTCCLTRTGHPSNGRGKRLQTRISSTLFSGLQPN